MKRLFMTSMMMVATSFLFAQEKYSIADGLAANFLTSGLNTTAEKDEFVSISYYESGKLKAVKPIVNGQLEGELLAYYPDGSLKRREFFEKGKSMGGTCYDMDGNVVPFEPFMKMAELKGDQDAAEFVDSYGSFIFRTKKSAMLDEVKMILSINQFGKMVGYQFLTEADKGTKERVDYVLRRMPDWIPAVEEGEYVPMEFELTIIN